MKQEQETGEISVVTYASRTLTSTERRYPQVEKKALALAWSCKKFRDYLIGTHFRLEIDHKPLITIFSKKNLEDLSPWLHRLKMRMMLYSYFIFHIDQERNFMQLMPCQENFKALDKRMKKLILMFVWQFLHCPLHATRLATVKSDATCK